jgi:Flp pilus assembly protein TadG
MRLRTRLRAARARRAAGERGAALVEAALITPVFALLVFGIIEFGLAFRDYLTVANAARDTARGASAFGDEGYADWNVIQIAKQSSKGFAPNELQRIIIFDAGSVNGSIFNASHPANQCLTRTTGVAGVCNVYTTADLNRPKSDFGCRTDRDLDRFWCPRDRETRASGPPDYVGVYVRSRHSYITGLFGDDIDLTDEIVMRIEPQDF